MATGLKYNIVKGTQYKRDCKAAKKSATSIRALLEVRADMEFFKKTGKHFLEFVTAGELQKRPELAIM